MNIEYIKVIRNQTNIILKHIKLRPHIELIYYIKPNIMIESNGNINKIKHKNNTGYYIIDKKVKSEYPIGSRYLEVWEEILIRNLGWDLDSI